MWSHQAKPILKQGDVEGLADPRLAGSYDVVQLRRLAFAASLCIRASATWRPTMNQVYICVCTYIYIYSFLFLNWVLKILNYSANQQINRYLTAKLVTIHWWRQIHSYVPNNCRHQPLETMEMVSGCSILPNRKPPDRRPINIRFWIFVAGGLSIGTVWSCLIFNLWGSRIRSLILPISYKLWIRGKKLRGWPRK